MKRHKPLAAAPAPERSVGNPALGYRDRVSCIWLPLEISSVLVGLETPGSFNINSLSSRRPMLLTPSVITEGNRTL